MNIATTIAPKSSQTNAEDFLTGPRTITITSVKAGAGADQPVAISYDGDSGRPYLPCKSMRRVLVAAWGGDGTAYVGRRLRLYNDPEVTFGADKTGGIRISHASHIAAPMEMALTVKRGKRKPYRIEPLPEEKRATAEELTAQGERGAASGLPALRSWWTKLTDADRATLGGADGATLAALKAKAAQVKEGGQ